MEQEVLGFGVKVEAKTYRARTAWPLFTMQPGGAGFLGLTAQPGGVAVGRTPSRALVTPHLAAPLARQAQTGSAGSLDLQDRLGVTSASLAISPWFSGAHGVLWPSSQGLQQSRGAMTS